MLLFEINNLKQRTLLPTPGISHHELQFKVSAFLNSLECLDCSLELFEQSSMKTYILVAPKNKIKMM